MSDAYPAVGICALASETALPSLITGPEVEWIVLDDAVTLRELAVCGIPFLCFDPVFD
jgi:hypothetical protein